MSFWIAAGIISALVAALIGRSMRLGMRKHAPTAAYDLEIYRDQLKDVDRDLARGVLSEGEAERVRTEVSRRILAADAAMQAEASPASRGAGWGVSVLTIVALIGGAGALYSSLGAPGYTDLPIKARLAASDELRATRLTQTEAEARAAQLPNTPPPEASADFLELMEKLRETVTERPDDLQGLTLLARNEASLGRSKQAAEAQARIIALKGDAASATDHAFYADLLVTSGGGYVSREAEISLRTALDIDPDQPIARYYLAQYMMQVDRPDAAFRLLDKLLRESTPDTPWLPSIRAQIEEVAYRAGVNFTLPPAAPGPDEAAITGAEDMSPEDRQAMIEGMVAQLSDRLATSGGSAQEWARLIRALGVLERYDEARSIFVESLQVFAGREAELNLLREAGQTVGISEDDL